MIFRRPEPATFTELLMARDREHQATLRAIRDEARRHVERGWRPAFVVLSVLAYWLVFLRE